MTGFRVLYLVLGMSFLFLSCSETKKVPSVKKSYNNDHLLFADNKKDIESKDNASESIKYEFNVGNLAVIVSEDRLYDVKYYSRLGEENKREVYFLDEELLDKFSEEELKQEVMGEIAFNSVVLDESRYKKEFKNSGIESLEILFFYQEKNLRKMEFDLLEKEDTNKKFESASFMEAVYYENVEGLNVRWFVKEDNSNNASKYTIYLETSINNIDLKKENIGINDMETLNSQIDDKVVSIMYRSSFIGEFDEKNKEVLVNEFTNILRELKIIDDISSI